MKYETIHAGSAQANQELTRRLVNEGRELIVAIMAESAGIAEKARGKFVRGELKTDAETCDRLGLGKSHPHDCLKAYALAQAYGGIESLTRDVARPLFKLLEQTPLNGLRYRILSDRVGFLRETVQRAKAEKWTKTEMTDAVTEYLAKSAPVDAEEEANLANAAKAKREENAKIVTAPEVSPPSAPAAVTLDAVLEFVKNSDGDTFLAIFNLYASLADDTPDWHRVDKAVMEMGSELTAAYEVCR